MVLVIASLATGGAGDRVRKQQAAVPLHIQQHSGSAGLLFAVRLALSECLCLVRMARVQVCEAQVQLQSTGLTVLCGSRNL